MVVEVDRSVVLVDVATVVVVDVRGTVAVVEGVVEGATVVVSGAMVVTVVVEVAGCAPGWSGDTHPGGAGVGTGSPGVTVPAQPISESTLSLVTDPPSANVATVLVCRMNPRASTETTSLVPT
jgi:hypothetical protein